MRLMVSVCGADDGWGVPAVTDSPLDMLERAVSEGVDEIATHTLFVVRPAWLPAVRKLVTLLRAHDPSRHYAVLVTDRLPLAATLVARHVNGLGLEPGQGAREVGRLLSITVSGVWVRRPGRAHDTRVSLWEVIRSWFSKDGYVLQGAGPVKATRARSEAWPQIVRDVRSLAISGDLPDRQVGMLRGLLSGEKSWGADVSPGARILIGKQRAFEFAAPRWGADERVGNGFGYPTCDSCGATIQDTCIFCHALWGASTQIVAEPQLAAATVERDGR